MATANNVEGRLTTDTVKFLKRHPLKIRVHTGITGPNIFYVTDDGIAPRPGDLLGTRRMHNSLAFKLDPTRLFTNPTAQPTAQVSFSAHALAVSPSNAPVTYTLDATGPALMLTTELSGCAINIAPGAGNTLVISHLQPTGESGTAVVDRLTTAGASQVFGKHAGPDHYFANPVSVVGVRGTNGWKIYAQFKNVDYFVRSVVKVMEIYPRRREV